MKNFKNFILSLTECKKELISLFLIRVEGYLVWCLPNIDKYGYK